MISQNARRDEDLVPKWASRLQNWGIGELAPFFVDILRPFGFLGAQALHLLSPILTTFTSPEEVERLADLLESPESLDHLSDTLSPSDRP
jgi:hypothetical protein